MNNTCSFRAQSVVATIVIFGTFGLDAYLLAGFLRQPVNSPNPYMVGLAITLSLFIAVTVVLGFIVSLPVQPSRKTGETNDNQTN